MCCPSPLVIFSVPVVVCAREKDRFPTQPFSLPKFVMTMMISEKRPPNKHDRVKAPHHKNTAQLNSPGKDVEVGGAELKRGLQLIT